MRGNTTIRFGDEDVFIMRRDWLRVRDRLPYRKTYRLKPGEKWQNSETTTDQWEHYVDTVEGPLPVGAMIARELITEGATTAVFTECWGRGCVLVGADLICRSKQGEMAILLDQVRQANGNRWAGLPDVIGLFADGRIVMREAKVAGKDRISQTQHKFARLARALFGQRLDLAVVEWGYEQA